MANYGNQKCKYTRDSKVASINFECRGPCPPPIRKPCKTKKPIVIKEEVFVNEEDLRPPTPEPILKWSRPKCPEKFLPPKCKDYTFVCSQRMSEDEKGEKAEKDKAAREEAAKKAEEEQTWFEEVVEDIVEAIEDIVGDGDDPEKVNNQDENKETEALANQDKAEEPEVVANAKEEKTEEPEALSNTKEDEEKEISLNIEQVDNEKPELDRMVPTEQQPTETEPQYLDENEVLDTLQSEVVKFHQEPEVKEYAIVAEDVKFFMEGVADDVEEFIGGVLGDVKRFKEGLKNDVANFFKSVQDNRSRRLLAPAVGVSFDSLEERITANVRADLMSEVSTLIAKMERKK